MSLALSNIILLLKSLRPLDLRYRDFISATENPSQLDTADGKLLLVVSTSTQRVGYLPYHS